MPDAAQQAWGREVRPSFDDRLLGGLRGHDSELAQAVAALSVAGVSSPWETPLGLGDRRLLALHREVTGRDLEVTLDCPSCGEASTVTLGPDDVPPWEPRSRWFGPGVGLREPVYADLAGLPVDPAAATGELLRRCAVGSLPSSAGDEDLAAVDTTLAGPLVVGCAGCGVPLSAAVDVERLALAGLFRRLDEIDVEVHLLARAYRWELATIEALPGDRRARLATLVAETA